MPVDFELRGCPINKHQLLEVIERLPDGRTPAISAHSVCLECKLRGQRLRDGRRGTPCLGPVTHAGCGAICPAYDRGCYGCFGPMEAPNTASLAQAVRAALGTTRQDLVRVFRTFNANAPASARKATRWRHDR